MRANGKSRQKVFTPSQVAQERAALLQKKLGILPANVDSFGYVYDPEQFHAALKRKNKKKIPKRTR